MIRFDSTAGRNPCRRALMVAALLTILTQSAFAVEPFVAYDRAANAQSQIVLQHDADAGTGYSWSEVTNPRVLVNSAAMRVRDAVRFLQEGVRQMTGQTLEVRNANDLSRGIVVTLMAHAPAELQNDPAIQKALRNDGSDSYNDREAFYLRSEKDRLLIVANTTDGLLAAMSALLESVGYEVLGMGPNWTYVPADQRQRLVFQLEKSERPSYYLRQLVPTSGQSYGVGTIRVNPKFTLSDPRDESVDVSYTRWAVGARLYGRSMPAFPGHSMQAYHRKLVEEMIRTGSTDGFLTAKNHLGLDADRPAASEANAFHLWINTDAKGEPAHGKVFGSDGKEWKEKNLAELGVNLDPTVPLSRQVVFEAMKQKANMHFAALPDDVFVFGTEPEDGAGYARIAEWMRPQYKNWYPDYLREQKVEWPRPYVLHGYRGIDQPQEIWDPTSPADVVFAFNNWLLREFDRWIDSLPEEERVTKTGRSKKELTRCSLYSYAYHDIPPHINLDPRVRVMIASYPKHRGLGVWKQFASHIDMAQAYRRMLPREPSGDYRIISIAYYADHHLEGLPASWSAAPARIVDDLKGTYEAGIRALTCETDFNFGKYGLAYYLMSKTLWNTNLSADDLNKFRQRWLQRAYGSGWREMEAYYDFMLIDNLPVNAPAAWAKAVRMIDAADAKIDPAVEPEVQRRLDDLKQYWYFYYLLDANKAQPNSPEMLEFTWKGQMSYMNAMHMVLGRTFQRRTTATIVPQELQAGPAHYTAEETAAWWKQIHEHWPEIEITAFADAKLVNGVPAREVDQNDLVRVADFQHLTTGQPFLYNSAQAKPVTFVTVARAGEPIGFRFSWPDGTELRFYGPKDVPYGIDFWDKTARRWTPVVDVTMTTAASQTIKTAKDGRVRHVAEVRHVAAQAGTYRIEVGRGGFLATLGSLGYDVASATFESRPPLTFNARPPGLTQDPAFIYIPKGTKSLDLEVWNATTRKLLQLYRGVSDKGLTPSREIDISRRGTHRIALEPGEDGNLARISGNGFWFPLLYSVPAYWAKCPAELVIPRAIAEADGLKILE